MTRRALFSRPAAFGPYGEKIKKSLNLISWPIFQKLMGTYFLNDHYVTQGPTGKIFQLAIAGQTGII